MSVGGILIGLLLLGVVMLLLAWCLRIALSALQLGPWACRRGWHWYRDFPLHTRQRLTGRTITYLGVAGLRVRQCRTCSDFTPPEGQIVYEQWKRAGIRVVDGARGRAAGHHARRDGAGRGAVGGRHAHVASAVRRLVPGSAFRAGRSGSLSQ
jgi:hypothetical protein